MNNYKVSKYFWYNELWHSESATRLNINNEPPAVHLENLNYLANEVVDKCREYVGGKLHASFYRSKALNDVTPGAAQPSYHMLGMAADIDCKFFGIGNNADLFKWMVNNLTFAQIIWEYGNDKHPDWIHVTAFAPAKTAGNLKWNEKKVTRALKEGSTIKYIPFVYDPEK